jgi:hypothetical protein
MLERRGEGCDLHAEQLGDTGEIPDTDGRFSIETTRHPRMTDTEHLGQGRLAHPVPGHDGTDLCRDGVLDAVYYAPVSGWRLAQIHRTGYFGHQTVQHSRNRRDGA